MNLNIKRHNFTNQSSILLKKIDDVGRATVQNTHTYLQHLSKELLSKLSKNKEGCFIIKTYDNFESFLL